jgi:hypothetical protein
MKKFFMAVVISTVFMLNFVGPTQAADPCNRTCLEGYIDNVLAAMIAHNPGQLMLAKDIRYTENGVKLIPGDGLWGTASARGKYNLYISDPDAGQVGFLGTLSENGVMDYIVLRVKVDEALISEIEVILARPSGMTGPPGGQTMPSAGEILDEKKPRPQFLKTVAKNKRMSRENLIEVANAYFTGLANQTGNFTAPFADTCDRWENGMQTTNQPSNPIPGVSKEGSNILAMNCEEQQKSGWFAFVTEIRNRRFPVVDIERGLVLSFGFFDHDGAVRTYTLPDGTPSPNPISVPTTIEIAELFQIREGKIDQIEAVINSVPYGMKSEVWDQD